MVLDYGFCPLTIGTVNDDELTSRSLRDSASLSVSGTTANPSYIVNAYQR